MIEPRNCRTCAQLFTPTERGKKRQCRPCNAAQTREYVARKKSGAFVSRAKVKRLCSLPGCDRPHSARGICKMHLERVVRKGAAVANLSPGKIPIIDKSRFFDYVEKQESGCWHYARSVSSGGYGAVKHQNKNYGAHRFAYLLAKGEIPAGLIVCHSCDNRLCVNPDHLWLGTKRDNAHDMMAKGRGRYKQNWDFCSHGHAMSGDNLKIYGSRRRCKACDLYRRRLRLLSREQQSAKVQP